MPNFIGYFVLWLLGLNDKLEAKEAKVKSLTEDLNTLLGKLENSDMMAKVLALSLLGASEDIEYCEFALADKLAEDRWLSPEVIELTRQVALAVKDMKRCQKCVDVTLTREKEWEEESKRALDQIDDAKREVERLRKIIANVKYVTHIVSLVTLLYVLGEIAVWFFIAEV